MIKQPLLFNYKTLTRIEREVLEKYCPELLVPWKTNVVSKTKEELLKDYPPKKDQSMTPDEMMPTIPGLPKSELQGKFEDNWAHRATTMLCKTCMWFVPKGQSTLGRCRRRAPTMNGFPAVFNSDWCGDHKLDENK